MCTDLNISIVINRIVTGGGDASLAAGQQQAALEPIRNDIRQLLDQGHIVFANYRPHRIQPDPTTRRANDQSWGPTRLQAVKKGWFAIFPSSRLSYLDQLEVWYLQDLNSSFLARNECYLDYGMEEVEAYVCNTLALGDIERLYPLTMAQVDPQAFWSAILHVDKHCEVLKSLRPGDNEFQEQWEEIRKGVQLSRVLWKKVAGASTCPGRLPDAVIDGNGSSTGWGILDSEDQHNKVAEGCAHIAVLMMLEAAEVEAGKELLKPMNVHLLDIPMGEPAPPIHKFAVLLRSLFCREQNELECGGQTVLHASDRKRFLMGVLDEMGYASSDLNYSSVCGHCGNNSSEADRLSVCSKCQGAAYCNRECQKCDWKKHKKECSSSLAQHKRAVHQLAAKYELL
ncbi:expressed unknown protein [Seminavis robusta]|uniref:MYND-type domain-containing protein n=1 Tax=Seminavis robusta TaxID=568900 RepID=A0A9N8EIH8_9STRA|nr:expressed unknown protein [Seminavis robusta]|eukprot:Sro1154_g247140.1 n/a (398) ;mRNA; r:15099-16292